MAVELHMTIFVIQVIQSPLQSNFLLKTSLILSVGSDLNTKSPLESPRTGFIALMFREHIIFLRLYITVASLLNLHLNNSIYRVSL